MACIANWTYADDDSADVVNALRRTPVHQGHAGTYTIAARLHKWCSLPNVDMTKSMLLGPPPHCVVTRRLHSPRRASLLAQNVKTNDGERPIVRLQRCACRPVSIWLLALPVGNDLPMSTLAFAFALR